MTENERLPHSKAGIASFVVGGIIFLYIGVIIIRIPNVIDYIVSYNLGIIGKTIIGNILGVILGVVGMRQRDKKRVFSILGFWINLIPIILSTILILVLIFSLS
ncbi:MAG: hypothetical protein E3J69_01735 [Anaerolineales bacterium]|nr:MAG: hypothetical protein E3J69_01735 [Anaerolineales bacterium]